MAGVPASNLAGTSFHSAPSSVTRMIMLPPVMNGGMASSSSRRPHSAPIPDGPSILWPLMARKSQSSALMSMGMCGAACAASTSSSAPASWTSPAISPMGLMVPSALLTMATATSFGCAGQLGAQVVHVELPVIGDRDVVERGAGVGRQLLPGHDVGVMLQLGRDDPVALGRRSRGPS